MTTFLHRSLESPCHAITPSPCRLGVKCLELTFMQWANGWWSSPVLDRVIPWVTHLGSHVAVVIFLILCLVLIKRKRLSFISFFFMASSLSCLRTQVSHQPKEARAFLEIFLNYLRVREKSSIRFSQCPYPLCVHDGNPSSNMVPSYKIIFYIAAGFIGWTRSTRIHFPTDVVVGGLLGYGITRLFLID